MPPIASPDSNRGRSDLPIAAVPQMHSGLLRSVPELGEGHTQELDPISGSVPSPYRRPAGCPFHPRCPEFIPDVCDVELPPQIELTGGHRVRCHLYVQD